LFTAPINLLRKSKRAGARVYAIVITKKYALTTYFYWSWVDEFCIIVMHGPAYVEAKQWYNEYDIIENQKLLAIPQVKIITGIDND
jgi:hypothetical protein